jgi:hypothetical protein
MWNENLFFDGGERYTVGRGLDSHHSFSPILSTQFCGVHTASGVLFPRKKKNYFEPRAIGQLGHLPPQGDFALHF